MNIYLMENGLWKYFENVDPSELAKRNISIGAGARIGELASIGEGASIGARASIGEWAIIGAWASIGECASIGAWARIGEGASIATSFHCVVMGPLGSRASMLTGYMHKKELWIGTGCYLGTVTDFEARVKKVHGDNEHSLRYQKAIRFFREYFG